MMWLQMKQPESPQPEGLISVLLNRDAPFGDRHDAAMDLGAYARPESAQALTSVMLDSTEDEGIIDAAAESLAEIWAHTRRFDREVFDRLPSAASPIFVATLDHHWPGWRALLSR